MPAADYVVRLIDRVTSVARGVSRSFERVEGAATKATKAVDRVNAGLGRSRDAMGRFVADSNKASGQGSAAFSRLAGDGTRSTTKVQKLFEGLAEKFEPLGVKVLSIGYKAVKASAMVGGLVGALGAVAAMTFTKQVLEMGVFAERTKTALGFLEKSAAGGIAAFNRFRIIARDTGGDVEDIATQGLALRRALFGQGESEELLKLMADMQSMGVTAEQTGRAVAAITQIKGKGRLQSEELVGQLAEAGVSTIAVFEQLEKMTGKSRSGVRKLLEGGKIDATMGIDAVKAAIKAQMGITEAGERARAFAMKTTSGLLGMLQSLPKHLFLDVSERLKEMGTFRDILRDVIRFLDPSQHGAEGREKLAQFVDRMVKGLRVATTLALDFAKGFGSKFDQIIKGLDLSAPSQEARAFAHGAGASLASFFAKLPAMVGVAYEAVKGFFRGLGLDSNSAGKALDKINFDVLGERAGAAAEIVGKTLRGMFDDLADGEFIANIGFRIGAGLVQAIEAAFLRFDIKRTVFGDTFADVTDWMNYHTDKMLGLGTDVDTSAFAFDGPASQNTRFLPSDFARVQAIAAPRASAEAPNVIDARLHPRMSMEDPYMLGLRTKGAPMAGDTTTTNNNITVNVEGTNASPQAISDAVLWSMESRER